MQDRRQQRREQLARVNQELDAQALAELRDVVQHALRHGISARLHSGQPHPTAVSEGALLIARALHRDGLQAVELGPVLALWRTPIEATDLFVAAEQLLGRDFCKLTWVRGTPLADLCEVLLGHAHEPGDLVAAGAIVASIARKLALLEGKGPRSGADRSRRPFVRKYTAGGSSHGSRPGKA